GGAGLGARAAGGQLEWGHDGPGPDGFGSLEASLVTLRGLFPWGDTRAGLESARRAAELEGRGSAWRPAVSLALGAGLDCTSDFAQADGGLAESPELAPAPDHWAIPTCALA